MKSILKLSFIASFMFCAQFTFSQVDIVAEKPTEKVVEENEEVPQIFKDYTWLKEHLNHKDCQGAKLSVLTNPSNSAHKYVMIEMNGKKTMYDTNGKQYCQDHSSLNCMEYYKLEKELDHWSCK